MTRGNEKRAKMQEKSAGPVHQKNTTSHMYLDNAFQQCTYFRELAGSERGSWPLSGAFTG